MIYALLALGNAAAIAAVLVFIVLYSRVRWESSPYGRSVMALSLSILLVAVGRLVANLVHPEAGQWFMLFGWPAVAAVMAWNTVHMWKLNRPRDPIDNSS